MSASEEMRRENRRHYDATLKRIQDDALDLVNRIRVLHGEVATDQYDPHEDTRARMSEAKAELLRALGSLQEAREQLPKEGTT